MSDDAGGSQTYVADGVSGNRHLTRSSVPSFLEGSVGRDRRGEMRSVGMIQRVRSNALLALSLVAVGLLAGCTAASPLEAPSTAPPVEFPDPVVMTGTDIAEFELEVPHGAQSLKVRIACAEGRFSIHANVDMIQTPDGGCGGLSRIALPVAQSSPMRLSVTVVPIGTLWVADFVFSEDALTSDPAIADDCEVLGVVISGVYNADAGFKAGDLDAAAWQAAIDAAAAPLDGMVPSPMIEPTIAGLKAWLADASTPGEATTARSPESFAAQEVASQVCTGNNSGLLLLMKYGG